MYRKKAILLLLSLFLLGSFAFGSGSQEASTSEPKKQEIRVAWFGNQSRHDLFNEIWDNFEKNNPDIVVVREFAATSDYWRKLTTQLAGKNAPDLFICQYIQFEDYVKRGLLLNLDDLVNSGKLDLSDLAPTHRRNAEYNGSTYGVSIGGSIRGMFYNTRMFEEAGIAPLSEDWTWKDFEDIGAQFKQTFTDPNVYLIEDITLSGEATDALEAFIRGYGYNYFEDGKIGFPKSVLKEWFELGVRFRAKGYFPPTEIQTEFGGKSQPQSMFKKNLVAMQMKPTNQFPLFQQVMDDKIELQVLPSQENGKSGSGSFIGSTNWVVSKYTKNADAVARALSYFTNTKEAVDIWQIQLGPIPNVKMLEYVKSSLSEPDQRVIEFTNEMLPSLREIAGFPEGGSEAMSAVRAIAERVGYGKLTPDEAVDEYFALAAKLLKN